MEMPAILLMNGPNLDMLGKREPEVYGSRTLQDVEAAVGAYAAQWGITVARFQSNSEGELINVIHQAAAQFSGIIYNPGAHTHYSYALRDAIAAIDIPVVEVHISDVDSREPFRRVSVIAPACAAQVKGLGVDGYCRAVDILRDLEAPVRLGDGFEARFEEGAAIKVAGRESIAQTPNQASDSVEASHTEGPAEQARTSDPIKAGRLSDQRLALLRDVCSRAEVSAFVVRDTPNIKWLTAIDGVFDEERAHALVVTPTDALLHSDSRYSNALRTQIARMGNSVQVNDERVGHMAYAHDAITESGDVVEGRVAIEDSITYAEYVKAVEAFGAESLVATSDVVLELRAVKSDSEIARLQAAQAITDAAFLHIVQFMRPGMTEREVQLELEDYMLRHGAEGLAFGSIVATGANGADPHAIPGQTQLEAGQCVVMDFGARAQGYCSDMTRMVFLGQPDERLAHAWEVLRQANETVEAQLHPGMTGKQAHELAEQVLADGGYAGAMGHGLGHGVGLEVHEKPLLNLRYDRPLQAGNVVTVEPGIYVPGEFGMRLEDCGVLTDGGYQVFSQLGHDLVVI